MPAPAVTPAPIVYSNVVVVKTLVFYNIIFQVIFRCPHARSVRHCYVLHGTGTDFVSVAAFQPLQGSFLVLSIDVISVVDIIPKKLTSRHLSCTRE